MSFSLNFISVDVSVLYQVFGSVTPIADEDRGVVTGAQGTTMSGSQQFLEEPNHIGMRGILRPCRYGTTWLKEGL